MILIDFIAFAMEKLNITTLYNNSVIASKYSGAFGALNYGSLTYYNSVYIQANGVACYQTLLMHTLHMHNLRVECNFAA